MARRARRGMHEEEEEAIAQQMLPEEEEAVVEPVKAKKKHEGSPQPVVGSMVYYHPGEGDPGPYPGEEPLAAIVAAVLTENAMNLLVIAADGTPYGKQGVLFCRQGSTTMGGAYCDVPGHEAAAPSDESSPRRAKAQELLAQAAAVTDRIAHWQEGRERQEQEQG